MFPPIWSIWSALSVLYRFFFIVLSVVAVWSLYVAVVVVARLRMVRCDASVNIDPAQASVITLQVRAHNLRQLIASYLYFFALVFFLNLPSAAFLLDDSHTPVSTLIWRNLTIHFAVAANAFLALLALHLLQWYVSARVSAAGIRLYSTSGAAVGGKRDG